MQLEIQVGFYFLITKCLCNKEYLTEKLLKLEVKAQWVLKEFILHTNKIKFNEVILKFFITDNFQKTYS